MVPTAPFCAAAWKRATFCSNGLMREASSAHRSVWVTDLRDLSSLATALPSASLACASPFVPFAAKSASWAICTPFSASATSAARCEATAGSFTASAAFTKSMADGKRSSVAAWSFFSMTDAMPSAPPASDAAFRSSIQLAPSFSNRCAKTAPVSLPASDKRMEALGWFKRC